MTPSAFGRKGEARHLGLIIVLVGLAGLVLLTGAYLAFLKESHSSVWTNASRQGDNTGILIRQDVSRTLEAYEVSFEGVIAGLDDSEVMSMAPDLRNMVLFDRLATEEFVGDIVVLDETGKVTLDSAGPQPRDDNFSKEDFFTVHRYSPDAGLFVGMPLKSSLLPERLALPISHRVNHPDGSFAGVVAATLSLGYFENLFGSIDLGPNGSVTLLTADGTILMRYSPGESLPGQNLTLLKMSVEPLTAVSGTFVNRSIFDGVDRFFSYRQIEPFGLTVVVGLSIDSLFADWTQKAVVLGLALLAVLMSIVGLTVVLLRQLRRRDIAERTLAALASTDPLSGLANRRVFDQTLGDVWRRPGKRPSSCAALMIDVGTFKAYNDTYGHPKGDLVIRAVADYVAKVASRSGDVVARYGGEEFVVLLPKTDAAGAERLARALCESVRALAIPHSKGVASIVTVSVGVATSQAGCGMPNALIERADGALYQAKRAGRNRVMVAAPDLIDQAA